jgi:hypothetical protein
MPTVKIESAHGADHEYLRAWAEFSPTHPPYTLGGDEALLHNSRAYTLLKSKAECAAATLSGEDHRFHIGLLPQPFHGRPATARIYVLMLNPGFSPDDYIWEYGNEPFRNSLIEQYRGGSPFLFLDPRFKLHPGYSYWYTGRQLAQLTQRIAGCLGLTYDETLSVIAQEFAALQLVPYHSSRFDATASLLNSLRSVQLARRFVSEYVLPRARKGECVIIVARGNWAWNLQPEENVVVYENPEYRSALLGPATRGGAAILAHYSGEKSSSCNPVIPPRESQPQSAQMTHVRTVVPPSIPDSINFKHDKKYFTSLRIDSQPLGVRLNRLSIIYKDQYIGEYERSQDADIDRKKAEIRCSLALLLEIYSKNGEFQVRWDGSRRVKSIRVNGREVGQIPQECWRKASWEK